MKIYLLTFLFLFSGEVFSGDGVFDTGMGLIKFSSEAIRGALELKSCGRAELPKDEFENLMSAVKELNCEAKEDLRDHCRCVESFADGPQSEGEKNSMQVELGFLGNETSSFKQKVLSDISNMAQIIGAYGDSGQYSCLSEEEMEKFLSEAQMKLKSSLNKAEGTPALIRKDFYDQAMRVNRITTMGDEARRADNKLMGDLSKYIAEKELEQGIVDFNSGSFSLGALSKEETRLPASLQFQPAPFLQSTMPTEESIRRSKLAREFLTQKHPDFSIYSKSPLFKAFLSSGGGTQQNFGDYLGRLSTESGLIKKQTNASLSEEEVSNALWAGSQKVHLEAFIDLGCAKITEDLKDGVASNYSNNKLIDKMSPGNLILSNMHGKRFLEELTSGIDPETKEGHENIERVKILKEAYEKRYRENLSFMKEEESGPIINLKNFELSRTICSNFSFKEAKDEALATIDASSGRDDFLNKFEESKKEVQKTSRDIKDLELALLNLESLIRSSGETLKMIEEEKKKLDVIAEYMKNYEMPGMTKEQLDQRMLKNQESHKVFSEQLVRAEREKKEVLVQIAQKEAKSVDIASNLKVPSSRSGDRKLPVSVADTKAIDVTGPLDIQDISSSLSMDLLMNYKVVERVDESSGEPTVFKSLERDTEERLELTQSPQLGGGIEVATEKVADEATIISAASNSAAIMDSLENMSPDGAEAKVAQKALVENTLDVVGFHAVQVQGEDGSQEVSSVVRGLAKETLDLGSGWGDSKNSVDEIKNLMEKKSETMGGAGLAQGTGGEFSGWRGVVSNHTQIGTDSVQVEEGPAAPLSLPDFGDNIEGLGKSLADGGSSFEEAMLNRMISNGLIDEGAYRKSSGESAPLYNGATESKKLQEKNVIKSEIRALKTARNKKQLENIGLEKSKSRIQGSYVPSSMTSGPGFSEDSFDSPQTQRKKADSPSDIEKEMGREKADKKMLSEKASGKKVESKEVAVKDFEQEIAREKKERVAAPISSEAGNLASAVREELDKTKSIKNRSSQKAEDRPSGVKASVTGAMDRGVASGAGSRSETGGSKRTTSNDPGFDYGNPANLGLNANIFEVTPVIEGMDSIYNRLQSFDAPKNFLSLSEKEQSLWVENKLKESDVLEALFVLPSGKKLLIKKK